MRNSKSSDSTVINLDTEKYKKPVIDIPVIPGYHIIREIGRGGTAVVFLGVHEKSGKKVAIKVLKDEKEHVEEYIYRFRRELEVLSTLEHENIIKIHDVGKTGKLYIVMEYIEYGLRELLNASGGALSKQQALKITRKIAKALQYFSSRGLIHRDIKPSNILFRQGRVPVLADFGLVKNLNSDSDFTKPYSVIGTPQYMSPEQCNFEGADPLSDIYSLGVVLFVMLSGKLPYDGKTWPDICKQHTDPSIPIPRLPFKLRDCQKLINCMMAKKKSKRIDADAVRVMIEELLSGRGRHKPKFLLLLFLLLVAIIGFVMVLILIFTSI